MHMFFYHICRLNCLYSFQQTDINVICFIILNYYYIKIDASPQNERKLVFNLHYDEVAELIWVIQQINDN